jgi:hypothetical protein
LHLPRVTLGRQARPEIKICAKIRPGSTPGRHADCLISPWGRPHRNLQRCRGSARRVVLPGRAPGRSSRGRLPCSPPGCTFEVYPSSGQAAVGAGTATSTSRIYQASARSRLFVRRGVFNREHPRSKRERPSRVGGGDRRYDLGMHREPLVFQPKGARRRWYAVTVKRLLSRLD